MMAGIYGVISEDQLFGKNLFKHFYSSELDGIKNEEYSDETFIFGRSVIDKFKNDRFISISDELIIAFEGICYSFNRENIKEDILTSYSSSGIDFVNDIVGQFCGFILDKKKNKLFLFTDQLSTKPLYLYYSKEKKVVFFSSELKLISKSLRNAGINITPENDAFRCLLTFGYMLGDLTPVSEIKKIDYGSIITISLDDLSMQKSKYFTLQKKVKQRSREDLLKETETTLINAIAQEWKKDTDYNYDHFSFLSGGLDSRVNAVIGSNLVSDEINTLTFSVLGTPDQNIAKRVAKKFNFNHTFTSLEKGEYLVGREYDYVRSNDGIVAFYGGAHQQFAVQKYNKKRIGLAHSGQIGDVVFGSFTKKTNSPNDNLRKLAFHFDREIIQKIELWNKMKENNFNGKDMEVFSLENRQVNGTLNGDRCCSHYIDIGSPFYSKEVLNLGLSIPDKYKFNQNLYLDWIRRYHLEMSRFVWAATGAKPSNSLAYRAISYKNRIINYLLRKVGHDTNNMNPFDIWYLKNPAFRSSLQNNYNSRNLIGMDMELQSDIKKCFQKDDVFPKMLAVTAVLSYRLHFLD